MNPRVGSLKVAEEVWGRVSMGVVSEAGAATDDRC
jgi:hypothetical protein